MGGQLHDRPSIRLPVPKANAYSLNFFFLVEPRGRIADDERVDLGLRVLQVAGVELTRTEGPSRGL